MSKVNLYSAFS